MSAAIERATEAFGAYAARCDEAPACESLGGQSEFLQRRIARWHASQYTNVSLETQALGVAEEAGELCRAVLKRAQGIRGMDHPARFREAAGKEVADVAISIYQMCTLLRLDFGALVATRAEEVMAERDRHDRPAFDPLAERVEKHKGELEK